MIIQPSNNLITKTQELEQELKQTGLWQNTLPGWACSFEENINTASIDFAGWLQFVFIPNHLHSNKTSGEAEKKLLVPDAIKFFGTKINKGNLLKILIELDSLL